MNDQQLHALWDRYRDSELGGDQRLAFEEYLRADPSARDLWDRESRWLAALADDPSPKREIDGPPFADRVIERWAWGKRSVAGRIAPWAAAAAVLLAASWVWVMEPSPDRDAPPVADTAPVEEPTDPLSVLVLDMSRQIERQPDQLAQAIGQTASLFDPQRITDMLEQVESEAMDNAIRLSPPERGAM